MKTIILITLALLAGLVAEAQNNGTYVMRYIHYDATGASNYAISHIVSDYGPRNSSGDSFWHRGIDYQPNQQRGNKILSPCNGTIRAIKRTEKGGMFYMIVEGDAGERHFGYAHLFRNKTIPEGQFWEEGPTGREMAIYRENEDNYIIINMDPANRYALAALTITRDTITYKGVLYNIQSGVTTDKPLAILGDPVVSHMLSPDNFIQAPDSIQSFNRYSYVTNNPLKYTDPSGNSYIETVKDWYSFEGGSFWYRGSHYNYNSENGTFSNNSGHNIGG